MIVDSPNMDLEDTDGIAYAPPSTMVNNNNNGRTCCGLKVQAVLPVIALIGCVMDIANGIVFFMNANCDPRFLFCYKTEFIVLGVLCVLCAFGYLMVFFAQREHNASLFLVFLVFKGIYLFIMIGVVIALAYFFISLVRLVGIDIASHALIIVLIPVFVTGVEMFFYCIICAAYNDVKETNQFMPQQQPV